MTQCVMAKNYSCRGECKRTNLSLAEMKPEPYLKSNCRGICKACHSSYNLVNIYIKGAEKHPEMYMDCNSCDKIFKKFKSGPTPKSGIRTKREFCPFCQSNDIEACA